MIDPELLPPAPARIADIGCGNGSVSRTLARWGYEVVGVDLSEDLLGQARSESGDLPVQFVRGDIHDLPFKDAEFDVVAALEVLEHVNDPAAAVAEITRITRVGGLVCVAVPTRYSEFIYNRLHPRYSRNATHLRVYSVEGMCALLEAAGLRVLERRPQHLEWAVKWLVHSLMRSEADHTGRLLQHQRITAVMDRVFEWMRRTHGTGRALRFLDRHVGKSYYYYCVRPAEFAPSGGEAPVVEEARPTPKRLLEALLVAQARARTRGLGRVPGLRRLGDRVVRVARQFDSIPVHTAAGILHLDPRDEGLAPALLTSGAYEPEMTGAVIATLREGMTFADVGANVGYYTLIAAKRVGANGRVYAFEPEPSNRSFLERNVRENRLDNVMVSNVAISDRDGTARLFVDAVNSGNPSFAEGNVSVLRHGVDVPTRTLDGFLNSAGLGLPDVIKIDVQGSEGLVLAGAQVSLEHACAVFIEIWPWGIRNMGGDPATLMESILACGLRLYTMEGTGQVVPGTLAEILEDLARDHNQRSHRNLLFRR